MKFCTWNMRRNKKSWEWLVNGLDPDIALLQESTPPHHLSSSNHFIWKLIGDTRRWGSGVYVKNLPVKGIPLKTFGGWVTAAEVRLNNNIDLTVISLHAQIVDGYSITTLHHILSDLTPLIDGAENILLGGDFNAGLLWDAMQKYPTHKIMFQRVEAFGLTNCHRLFHETEERTFRNKSDKDWHIDHLFISTGLAKRVKSCDILENEETRRLSDHNPTVMVMDL